MLFLRLISKKDVVCALSKGISDGRRFMRTIRRKWLPSGRVKAPNASMWSIWTAHSRCPPPPGGNPCYLERDGVAASGRRRYPRDENRGGLHRNGGPMGGPRYGCIAASEFVRKACKEFPDRVILGIDARGGQLAVQGWTEMQAESAVTGAPF